MDKAGFQDIRNLVDEIEGLYKAIDNVAQAIRDLDENGGDAELCVHGGYEYGFELSGDKTKEMLWAILEFYLEHISEGKNRIDFIIDRMAGGVREALAATPLNGQKGGGK